MIDKIRLILGNKKVIILVGLAVLIGAVFFVFFRELKPQIKQNYEAAIMVYGQSNPDPIEDARTSLKAGDVVVIFPEGHSWSTTERASWLILKLSLTQEQADKLVLPKTKAVKRDCPSEMPKEECKTYAKSEETVIARQYAVDVSKLGVDIIKARDEGLLKNKILDWSVVLKK